PDPAPAEASSFDGTNSRSHVWLDTSPGLRLIGCPACEAQISNSAASCPRCGHPMREPSDTPSVATHREFLEELISPYKLAGYQVVQQTEYAITMVKARKRISVGIAVILYILFWPAGVAYTLSRWNNRDKVACFRVLPSGQVEISGDVVESHGERGPGWVLPVFGLLTLLAVVAVFILARAR
ncbi:MAG TPA: zinc ribbon domain-containing protein, partial [Blastocatellia bacterium]|nr:zinc ribbon domain-containing protein [Blastocatellia bacterium]